MAAHITAASPEGPRFDSELSENERRSPRNGIWLCQTCAKLVDSDVDEFTVKVLQGWKRMADDRARLECGMKRLGSSSVLDLTEQSTKILSTGSQFNFSIEANTPEGDQKMAGWARSIHCAITAAFLDTCVKTGCEDFVYLGRLYCEPPEPPANLLHFCFEVSCHVTHFVTTFEQVLGSVLEPEQYPESQSIIWPDHDVEFEWHDFQAYRITRVGPKQVSIQYADSIKTIDIPFSTSSMLTLLAQIKNCPLLILDDAFENKEELDVFRYLGKLNGSGKFSLDDFQIEKTNPEVFRFT